MLSFYPVHVLGFQSLLSGPGLQFVSDPVIFVYCSIGVSFLIFNYHSGFCFDQLVVVFVKILFLEIVSQTCFFEFACFSSQTKIVFCGSAKRDLGVYFVRRLNQQTKLII